jgi:hypothetical protein
MAFSDEQFRSSSFMRLKAQEKHIMEKRLNTDLRWTNRNSVCAGTAPSVGLETEGLRYARIRRIAIELCLVGLPRQPVQAEVVIPF